MGNKIPLGLPYEDFQYPPNTEQRNFLPLKDHKVKFCDALVRYETNATPFTWEDPAIAAQLYIIASFLAFFVTRMIINRVKSNLGERKLRNTAIYIVQLAYSLIALPVVSITLAVTFMPSDMFSGADLETWPFTRSIIVGQAILFQVELFYRINVRPELILHHVLASGLVMFLNWVGIEYLAGEICVKLGCVLTLFAVTEQLNYLALILRNMGYGNRMWWKKMCYFSAWIYISSKLAIGGLAFYVLSQFRNDGSFHLKDVSFVEWIDPSADIRPKLLLG